jgi:hypothetical protein
MTKRAIRRIAEPIVRDLAGAAFRKLLDPCVRLTWWTVARRRWIPRGRVRLVRLANWRIGKLWKSCKRAGGTHCDGEDVASRVLRAVERQVAPIVG